MAKKPTNRNSNGRFESSKKTEKQEDTNPLALAKKSVVRKEPKSSFEERTQKLQPWQDDDGNQVNQ